MPSYRVGHKRLFGAYNQVMGGLITPTGSVGAQIPSADTPNEPLGYQLVTQNDFTSTILAAGWTGEANYQNFYSIENDPQVSRDGNPYLRLFIQAGHAQGTGFPNLSFTGLASLKYSEVYYKFWLRISTIAPYNSNVQKLLHWWMPNGVGGTIQNIALTNSHIGATTFSMRAALQNVEPSVQLVVSPGGAGGNNPSGYAAGAGGQYNEWIRVEGNIKMNQLDDPANNDGFHKLNCYNPRTGITTLIAATNVLFTVDVPAANRYLRNVDIDPTIPGATSGGVNAPTDYNIYFSKFYISGKA